MAQITGNRPPIESPFTGRREHKNFDDAQVTVPLNEDWNTFADAYGVDLDNDGEFDEKKDGIVAWDDDGDGKLSAEEIERGQRRMRAVGGEDDLDGDGEVTALERYQAEHYRDKYDPNGDGVVTGEELQATGGDVWQQNECGEWEQTGLAENAGFKIDTHCQDTTSYYPFKLGRIDPGPVFPPVGPGPILDAVA